MQERVARPRLDKQTVLVLLGAALTEAVNRKRLRYLLEGLFTNRQREELAQRFRIAHLLHAGRSYRGIEDETRASPKTIVLVDRWLRRENPSYRRLYPIRHKRRYRKTGQFPDVALSWPGSVRGQVTALFGLDPRQR